MKHVNQIRNITRYEYNRTNGWWVRVIHDGKVKSKLFSDNQHGGKVRALLAAIDYRDGLLRDLPKARNRGGLSVEKVDGEWLCIARFRSKTMNSSLDKHGQKAIDRCEAWLDRQRTEYALLVMGVAT